MKKYLVKLADHLDKKGLYKEANYLDNILKKAYEDENNSYQGPEGEDAASESPNEGGKMYVVLLETGECAYAKGVFDSKEKADEAIKQSKHLLSGNSYYELEEFALNNIDA